MGIKYNDLYIKMEISGVDTIEEVLSIVSHMWEQYGGKYKVKFNGFEFVFQQYTIYRDVIKSYQSLFKVS